MVLPKRIELLASPLPAAGPRTPRNPLG